MVAEDLLQGLNPAQKQVAQTTDGPVMVLAGAGTGKTRCIIFRAGYLIATRKVRKENLLIVTFTNKAARELRERLAQTFGLPTRNLWVGTFHSIFGRILRFEAGSLPFNANYVIYDDKDQASLIKKVIKKLNVDTSKFKPKAVLNVISKQKNNLITIDKYWEFNESNPYTKTVYSVYKEYQKFLVENNALDFDDILVYSALLMADNKRVRAKWQRIFRYIMVDEYQDTNYAQFVIVKHLAMGHQNICVVGDDDQAIYSWRGATPRNLRNFERDFTNVKTIKLERNYRSHENILKLANSLINHNRYRHEKELYTDYKIDNKPVLADLQDEREEAVYVTEIIKEVYAGNYSQCAVLYRTNMQSRVIEQALVKKKIPYRIYGGVNFYQRKEVKDAVCYLKLLVNEHDRESLDRVLKMQKGIGKKTIENIYSYAEEKNVSAYSLILNGDFAFLTKRTAAKLSQLKDLMTLLTDKQNDIKLHALLLSLIINSPLGELYGINSSAAAKGERTFEDPEKQSRYENLCELLRAVSDFSREFESDHDAQPTVSDYITSAALQTDLDTNAGDSDAVNLMTMHNAKGLEFDHVIIVGLEEGLLPHRRSLDERFALEEERRLLYVGITRARKTLHLTLTRMRRTVYGMDCYEQSRFINDFDHKYLKKDEFDPHAYLKPSRAKKNTKKQSLKVILESQKHFKIGQEINHPKFGKGMVLSIDGKGKDARLIIKFESGSIKKIIGSYVEII